jgi:hypothetical protein
MSAPDQPKIQHKARRRRRLLPFHRLLTPFFVFALGAAIVCWIAAWVFQGTYELLVTLVSVGCFLIVVAVCAYLYLLVTVVEQGD